MSAAETWDGSEVVLGRGTDFVRKPAGRWGTVLAYVELTKPKSVALLVFTAFAGMVLASSTGPGSTTAATYLLGLAAITAGCAGCNALTCYIDRDIDAVMERTKHRPLPEGRIRPVARAAIFAALLLVASVAVAAVGNPLAALLMVLGILDNVVVYSAWTKRSSSWNIVLGSVSGGMPVAFGWAFVSGTLSVAAILAAALVVLWTPTHIWSLALRYKEDYARAGIPMLPVVAKESTAVRCMVSTASLLVPLSLAILPACPSLGLGYAAVAVGFGIPVLAINLWLGMRPSRERAWLAFKFSSPYLALVFLALILDALL